MVSDGPMLYLANAQAPFNNLKELVAAAKAKPGSISWSSAGNGSINHLAGEWLAQAAGIQVVHVPYKGGAPAATAVAAGDVQFGVIARSRGDAAPEVGARQGGGHHDREEVAARTVVEHAARRRPRRRRVDLVGPVRAEGHATGDRRPDQRARCARRSSSRTCKARLGDAGFEAVGMTQADFVARIRKDLERYREIVKAANMKAE